MHDPRLDQLARQLVRFSTTVKKGENVLIDLYDTPSEMGVAMIRAVREAGGVPFLNLNDARLVREVYRKATEPQIAAQADVLLHQMKKMQAYIAVAVTTSRRHLMCRLIKWRWFPVCSGR